MKNNTDPMDKFSFLIGKWNLEYTVPKSQFSEKNSGMGHGEFKRILNNEYVSFDYYAELKESKNSAHAVFVWDQKSQIYRYWWFEDSGAFMEAACNFINEDTLALNWHNSLLVQTFHKMKNNKIVLEMKYPQNNDSYETILEVRFSRVKE